MTKKEFEKYLDESFAKLVVDSLNAKPNKK